MGVPHRLSWRTIAAVVAAATLSSGLLIPVSAFADESAPMTESSQTAKETQDVVPSSSDGEQVGQQAGGTSEPQSDDGQTEASITSLDDPQPIVMQSGDGTTTLPWTVVAHYDDGSVGDVDVTWSGDGYMGDGSLAALPAGEYQFIGMVEGVELTTVQRLTVVAENATQETDPEQENADGTANQTSPQSDGAAPLSANTPDDIVEVGELGSSDTHEGGNAYMPSGVEVTYADGTTGWAPVDWNTTATVTYSDGTSGTQEFDWTYGNTATFDKEGTYTFTGVLCGSDLTTEYVVYVWAIRSIESPTVYTAPGTAPKLDSYLDVERTDGVYESLQVTWDPIDPSLYAEDGKFTVEGTIDGITQKAVATVYVTSIVSVMDSGTYYTVPGHPLTLPYQTIASYADGSSHSVEVTWDSVDDSLYDTVGSFDVEGTVEGTDLKAHVAIVVDELASTEASLSTSVGEAPGYWSVSFPLVGGGILTGNDFVWDYVDPSQYAEPGTYDLTGTIETDLKTYTVTLHVTVIGIASVDSFADITTITGILPTAQINSLFTTLRYTDGSTETTNVWWDSVGLDKVAQPGEFDLAGRTAIGDQEVSVHIIVMDVDSQREREVSVSTLTGVAPQLPLQLDVQMWDGALRKVNLQWTTPSPNDYAQPGTFDITGYLEGSGQFSVIAHVAVYDGSAEQDISTVVGVAPRVSSTLTVTLTNGDVFQMSNGVVWDPVDPAQYAQPGTFDMHARVLGSNLVPVAHVSVVQVYQLLVEDPYVVRLVAGRTDPYLPQQLQGLDENGNYVIIPITWGSYDTSKFDQPGAVVEVTGTYAGNQTITAEIHVVGVTSLDDFDLYAMVGQPLDQYQSAPYMQVTYSDGTTGFQQIVWDIDDSSYDKVGDVAITGTVYGSDYQTTGTLHVTDAFTVAPMTVWTVPGVAPSLPYSAYVTFDDASDETTSINAEIKWDVIDPKLYADENVFTVNGTLVGGTQKVTATVEVSAVDRALVPDTVTAPGVAPQLPGNITVVTKDGKKRTDYVTWDSVPASTYQEVGDQFTVTGHRYAYLQGGTVTLYTVTTTVHVRAVDSVDTAVVDQPVTTKVGVRPSLPYSLPVMLDDGFAVFVPVDWDSIPPEQYAEAGSFEVGGTLNMNLPATKARAAQVDGDRVTITVNVKQDTDEREIGYITPLQLDFATDDDIDLPDEVYVSLAGGNTGIEANDQRRKVTWNVDEVKAIDTTTPGTYRVSGTVEGSDRTAYCYVTVSRAAAALFDHFDEVRMNVAIGTPAQNIALTDKVVAHYSDGTTQSLNVRWDKTPLTVGALSKEGEIVLEGTVDGLSDKARAIITVTDKNVATGIKPVEITVDEGDRPELPSEVTVEWKDADGNVGTTQENVVWDSFADSQWADGMGGTVFTVEGTVSSVGLKTTATVTVRDVFTVIFDSNGGTPVSAQRLTNGQTSAAEPGDPTRENGFEFAGWTLDGQPYDFSATVTGDIMLVAQWKDVQGPHLNGVGDVTVLKGSEFDSMAGVTAVDNLDGDMTSGVTVEGSVDTSTVGEYTLTYTAPDDAAGNKGQVVTRTVTVSLKPVAVNADEIAIGGEIKDGTMTLKKGKSAELTAKYNADATNVSVSWASSDDKVVTIASSTGQTESKTGNVVTITAVGPGKATITMTVTQPQDGVVGSEEETYVKSIEVVVPATPVSAENVMIEAYAGHRPGAGDSVSIPDKVTVLYDDGTTTEAKVSWDGVDDFDWSSTKAGDAETFDGSVTVDDTTLDVMLMVTFEDDAIPPTIEGAVSGKVPAGGEFDPMAGVTASDNLDGDLTDQVRVSIADTDGDEVEKVNTTDTGVYTLTYTVDDAAGNTAQVTRIIEVAVAYTISFDSNGGSAVDSITVFDGEIAVKPVDPTRDGYRFVGWTLNGEAYDFTTPVTEDLQLVAQWEKSPATAGIANGDDESGDVVQIAITGAAVLSLVVLDVALALSGSAILGYRFSRSRGKHQR